MWNVFIYIWQRKRTIEVGSNRFDKEIVKYTPCLVSRWTWRLGMNGQCLDFKLLGRTKMRCTLNELKEVCIRCKRYKCWASTFGLEGLMKSCLYYWIVSCFEGSIKVTSLHNGRSEEANILFFSRRALFTLIELFRFRTWDNFRLTRSTPFCISIASI